MHKKKDLMIDYMWTFIGNTPYKWGGNVIQDGGLDCSGYVLEGLRSIGLWGLRDATSQDIFSTLKKRGYDETKEVERGDLMFFGRNFEKIIHVSVCINKEQMIEAGGDNKNGMVRVRPLSWRRDFLTALRFL